MNKSALNARLCSAAELVRQNATFADIGTDHAYLPLFLLDEGRISFAYCADINEGPLASAGRNARERGREGQIELVLTDGAAALEGRGITDYAICGMGGELIADIIDRAPHLREGGVNLILQPMTKQAHLRKYLAEKGFSVIAESYSFDAGKYYLCLLATYTGEVRHIDGVEAELGGECRKMGDTSAEIGYIQGKIKAYTKAREGKKQGGEADPTDEKIIEALKARLTELLGEGDKK